MHVFHANGEFVITPVIYVKKFQRVDWLKARQLTPDRLQKSEISAKS